MGTEPAAERVERLLSEWVGRGSFLGLQAWQWLGVAGMIAIAILGGLATGALLRVLRTITKRTPVSWDDELVSMLRRPSRLLGGVVTAHVHARLLRLPAGVGEAIDRALQLVLIASLAWTAIGLVHVVASVIERRAERDAADAKDRDLRLRGLRTQVFVLRRVAAIVVTVIALAMMLVQFEVVRTLGLSLLASAGLAGIVVGIAAQRTIASLLAGIQLSIVQAVRIGDTVVFEGEVGQVEEINLTYIVVKVWDQRRLILPVSRVLEQPFQNWTKVSPELLGTVFVHADYGLPIDAARQELDRILRDEARWDGRVKGITVTGANESTIEIRAVVSAADASTLWDLRCAVREKLVAWLATFEGGRHLPRRRVDERSASGSPPR